MSKSLICFNSLDIRNQNGKGTSSRSVCEFTKFRREHVFHSADSDSDAGRLASWHQ